MKPNIELAEKLLKEKYSITGDGKEFKLQYPIYVEDLAFIMQKYTEEQLIIDSISKSFYCWDENTGQVMVFQIGRMYSIRNESDDRKILALCTQSNPHHLINVHHASNVHYIRKGL